MLFSANVTLRMACGSWKSGSQPTFGQMFGSFFGTLQYFVYIVACVTEIVLTSKPILAMSAATTCAVFEPGGELSATIVTCGPLYIPFAKPALRQHLPSPSRRSRGSRGLGNGLNPRPPAWAKP